MTRKEQLKIAKRIAQAELILKNSKDKSEQLRAKKEIISVSNAVTQIEDLIEIEILVQTFLKEEKIGL